MAAQESGPAGNEYTHHERGLSIYRCRVESVEGESVELESVEPESVEAAGSFGVPLLRRALSRTSLLACASLAVVGVTSAL
jgi:hypothetical protein